MQHMKYLSLFYLAPQKRDLQTNTNTSTTMIAIKTPLTINAVAHPGKLELSHFPLWRSKYQPSLHAHLPFKSSFQGQFAFTSVIMNLLLSHTKFWSIHWQSIVVDRQTHPSTLAYLSQSLKPYLDPW